MLPPDTERCFKVFERGEELRRVVQQHVLQGKERERTSSS